MRDRFAEKPSSAASVRRHRWIGAILACVGCQTLLLLWNCASPSPQHGWDRRQGPLVSHETFPGDCSLCHYTGTWQRLKEDFTFDHEAETGYALLGAHERAACLRCHNDRGPIGFFADRGCSGCHEDPHQSRFGMDCQSCHDEESWEPDPRVQEHSATSFPLTGPHAALPCELCHERADAGIFSGEQTQCEFCHQDDIARSTTIDHTALGLTSACESCHAPAQWSAVTFSHDRFPLTGAHASLDCESCHASGTFAGLSSDCYSCHESDYQGQASHVQASYPLACDRCHSTSTFDGAAFDHSSFPLTGGHAGVDCESCHPGGAFAGTSMECFSCHAAAFQSQPTHVAAGFSTTCTDCHLTTTFVGAAGFSHDQFPLTGGHGSVTCESCHADGVFSGRSSECASCHMSDYQSQSSHVIAGFPTTCQDCHTPVSWATGSFDHSGFPLSGSHALPCESCHGGGVFVALSTDCYSCHQADYEGQPLHVAAGFPTDCEQCHTATSFASATFSHTPSFPLTGGHAAPSCDACHTGGVFAGLPSDCASCHLADYQGQPLHVSASFPTTCQDCHTTSGWAPSTFSHTPSFPLTGGHAAPSCDACHTGGVFAGLASDCASCHLDDYQGQPSHVSASFPLDCTQCHTTSGWGGASFTHTASFPLTGGHAGPSCDTCHTGGVFAGLPSDCVSCHLTDYQGQPLHVSAGFPTDCEQCHTTSSFAGATFTHTPAFPLTGGHAGQPCEACHASGVYAGLPSDCYSCHSVDYMAQPLHVSAGFPTDCTQCHTTSGWAGATFSHTPAFPLTGGHAGQPCEACHASGVYAGLPSDCYSCHASDYAAQPSHVAASFPTDCSQCHSTSGWGGASFTHTAAFPLTGAHSGHPCSACHSSGVYAGLPSDCYSCHQSDYEGADYHTELSLSHECQECHTPTTWGDSSMVHTFELHGHHDRPCTECHTGGTTSTFDCLGCHHQGSTDDHHSGVSGYVYESTVCITCHPDGHE